MNPVKLSEEQIKRLAEGLHTLHDDQRALVRETLQGLMRAHQQIGPVDLHQALRPLREGGRISEIDEKAVVAAVFP